MFINMNLFHTGLYARMSVLFIFTEASMFICWLCCSKCILYVLLYKYHAPAFLLLE